MILTKAALAALFLQCAPQVAPTTLETIVSVESSGNPNVIAVVDDGSSIYPEDKASAIKFTKELEKQGKNYSAGLMQVNKKNFVKYGLDIDKAYEPCNNIATGAKIYEQCYIDAKNDKRFPDEQAALRGALSCYYSGNMSRGFVKEGKKNESYVDRANNAVNKIYSVPAIKPNKDTSDKDYVVAQDDIKDSTQASTENKPKKQPWDVYGDFNL